MKKYYSSDSHIAINILLENGNSMHIAFTPISNGGSTYNTEVEVIQNALENHYRYNDLFVLDREEDTNAPIEEPTQNTEEDPNQEEESNIRKVKVNDLGEAKDYLAETFGVSRTSLRGQKAILEAAKANNIEFEGL
jgi:conserved domain protein|nr:MAG TPA: bacterial regulatory protein [Caudoviricetes sp.]